MTRIKLKLGVGALQPVHHHWDIGYALISRLLIFSQSFLPMLHNDHLGSILIADNHRVRLEAGASSATVNLSFIPPASAFSHQPGNSVFLSYHSSSSFQLQPAERSVGWKTESPRPGSCSHFYQPNNHGSQQIRPQCCCHSLRMV